MKQVLKISELPPLLNVWQRMHWLKRVQVKESWGWLIRAETPSKHTGRVNISFTRISTSCPDPDNTAGSFKPIGDALVKAGIITDDSFKVIENFSVKWEKAKSKKQQGIVIEISDT